MNIWMAQTLSVNIIHDISIALQDSLGIFGNCDIDVDAMEDCLKFA